MLFQRRIYIKRINTIVLLCSITLTKLGRNICLHIGRTPSKLRQQMDNGLAKLWGGPASIHQKPQHLRLLDANVFPFSENLSNLCHFRLHQPYHEDLLETWRYSHAFDQRKIPPEIQLIILAMHKISAA